MDATMKRAERVYRASTALAMKTGQAKLQALVTLLSNHIVGNVLEDADIVVVVLGAIQDYAAIINASDPLPVVPAFISFYDVFDAVENVDAGDADVTQSKSMAATSKTFVYNKLSAVAAAGV